MTNNDVLTQYQSEALEALGLAANLGKPFEKVIMDTLKLFMAIPDKKTFLNIGRYGMFSEQTYRNALAEEEYCTAQLQVAATVCLSVIVTMASTFYSSFGR